MGSVLFLLTSGIHGRGHATDDLPRAVLPNPRVRNPDSVGLHFGACAVCPRRLNSIIIHREIAGYLNRELLDRVRPKVDPFVMFASLKRRQRHLLRA